MLTNTRKQHNTAAQAKTTTVSITKGIEPVLALSPLNPEIASGVNAFCIETSCPTVVLCTSDGVPVQGEPLNTLYTRIYETGGAAPRAFGGLKWQLMNLDRVKALVGDGIRTIFLTLEAFPSKGGTMAEAEAHAAFPQLLDWSHGRTCMPNLGPLVGVKQFVPGPGRCRLSRTRIIDWQLAVLADAIAARDAVLVAAMVRSVQNILKAVPTPRLTNEAELVAVADRLADALFTREDAALRDARPFNALRDELHPLDYYAAVRLVMMGAATSRAFGKSTTHLFARNYYGETKEAVMLSLLFDPAAQAGHSNFVPFYASRALSDSLFRINAKHWTRTSTETELVAEMLQHAETSGLVSVLKHAYVVIATSLFARTSLLNSSSTSALMRDLEIRMRPIERITDAVRLIYPDARRNAALSTSIAELVYCGTASSSTEARGSLVSIGALLASGVPHPALRALVQRNTNHTLETARKVVHVRTMVGDDSWAAFAARFATAKSGDSERVAELLYRIAFELQRENFPFVKEALTATGLGAQFLGAKGLARAVRPMLKSSHISQLCGLEWNGPPHVSSRRPLRRKVHAFFRAPAPPTHLLAPPTHLLDRVAEMSISESYYAGSDAAAAATNDAIDAIDAIEDVHGWTQATATECSSKHACPICFDAIDQNDAREIHAFSGHPSDYRVCQACLGRLHTCPFCRFELRMGRPAHVHSGDDSDTDNDSHVSRNSYDDWAPL